MGRDPNILKETPLLEDRLSRLKGLPVCEIPGNISDINHPLHTIYGFDLGQPKRSEMLSHLRSAPKRDGSVIEVMLGTRYPGMVDQNH
jgi:hypothetical protein